jgi:hypothetical protein
MLPDYHTPGQARGAEPARPPIAHLLDFLCPYFIVRLDRYTTKIALTLWVA